MNSGGGRVADATGDWVDTAAPDWLKPYLRLIRSGGVDPVAGRIGDASAA